MTSKTKTNDHDMEKQLNELSILDNEQQLVNLRRPIAVIKKRSGPLDDVLNKLNQIEDIPANQENDTKASAITTVDNKTVGHNLQYPIMTSHKLPSKTTSPGRRRSTKEKDKKRERWLLTRKTWRYMTDAGRKLIPDGLQAQNNVDDISLIDAEFQHVCASEPRFILWRRKFSCSSAGGSSIKNSRRRLKLLSRHNSQREDIKAASSEQDDNLDQAIELLQSYLKIREAYKTTTLLGTKTIRPDQTASPSSQRPMSNISSEQLVEAELLTRLKILSQGYLLGVLPVHSDNISPTILDDKVLLKKIFNILKRQQLHRILSKHMHSNEPNKSQLTLSRTTSLSSLFNCNTGADDVNVPSFPNWGQINMKSNNQNVYGISNNKNTEVMNISEHNKIQLQLKNPEPPNSNLKLMHQSLPKFHNPKEKIFGTCGTQTNFIQLCELKRLAEFYKQQKQVDGILENCNNYESNQYGATEEELDKPGSISYRKSSIDNEDVSQSVSNTIKRYLRMARKKSVHEIDAVNRFGRVNYDRNLRNIKAKGEINPPGMDDNLNKAVQTLDAWPLIALDYIRGIETTKTLEDAHLDWQIALDERIKRKLKWESRAQNGCPELNGHSNNKSAAHNPFHKTQAICASAPTSPTNIDRNSSGKDKIGMSASNIITSSSHFLSNLWHSNSTQVLTQQHGNTQTNNTILHISPENESTNMQKSKSLSNVGTFVSRKIWRSRSKSQSRSNYEQCYPSSHSERWSPTDNCTWISENGTIFEVTDTSLEKLSDIETTFLMRFAAEKIKELNIGANIDFEKKTQKRRIIQKKKALTTSFFDIGKKDDHNGRDILFGTSLEHCLSRDRKRILSLNCPSGRGQSISKHSLTSVFRNSSGACSAGGKVTKLSENVRSCESLPSKGLEQPGRNDNSDIEQFTNLHKSLSTQISRSQSDMRDAEYDLLFKHGSQTTINSESKRVSELCVPIFVTICITYLEEHGLQKVGLFRVSTSKKRVKQLREEFDNTYNMNIPNDTCPHDVATLLKEFLRDLPDPLLCKCFYATFLETQKIRNRRLQLESISSLIKLLPPIHRNTLYVLLKFLAKVAAHSDDVYDKNGTVQFNGNKMDSSNLATVFTPNILREGVPKQSENKEKKSMSDAINVIRIMIDHYEEIFKVPSEIMDLIYSQMLDECPHKLFDLFTTKLTQSETESMEDKRNITIKLAKAENNDCNLNSDNTVDGHKEIKRCNDVEHNISTKNRGFQNICAKQMELVNEERRRSTPVLVDRSGAELNAFSGKLHILVPEKSKTPSMNSTILNDCVIPLNANELKLSTSISNIGGEIINTKAAEFEQNDSKDCKSLPILTTRSQQTIRRPLYKRQQLIPSSKRLN